MRSHQLSRLALAALLGLVGCGGCSPAYVLRSAYEESRILWRREPIAEVLARPDVDAETRRKLETVLAVRRFAHEELGLEVGGAYSSYSEVPEGALLHVLTAAERARLEPYTWWFPIVGRVAYKGYFSRSEADAEAGDLDRQGYDTTVRGSVAFSTLGWFDDPVLSSWMRGSRARIAELVMHELLHRTTYLGGQTAFNESFANFVGHRGAIAFFAATEGEDAETTRAARAAWAAEIEESVRLMRTVARLRALYDEAARSQRPLDQVLEERARIFAEQGDSAKLNNAVILALSAYLDQLQLFEGVYAASGDLRLAIARIRAATEADAADPWRALLPLAQAPAAPG